MIDILCNSVINPKFSPIVLLPVYRPTKEYIVQPVNMDVVVSTRGL